MNEVVKQPQAFQAMSTSIDVSMDDVVSAFVSQYENNLYTRKKELSSQIKALDNQMEDLVKRVKKEITGDEFVTPLPLGLVAKLTEKKIDFDNKEVNFTISVKEKEVSRWGNTITVTKRKALPARFAKEHDGIENELKELRGELSEVLVNLKSITRKERQVRGRIAMRKLEDSGYASLMQDDELIQLVQLED